MNKQELVKKLSKLLGWEITPFYITGINFVVENAIHDRDAGRDAAFAALYGGIKVGRAEMPANPSYTLVANCCNVIEDFDPDNPVHLEKFMVLVGLKPTVTSTVNWSTIITFLETFGHEPVTLENVELAGRIGREIETI